MVYAKYTGGIIGRLIVTAEAELDNCLFTGKISVAGAQRNARIGGFAGATISKLTIKNSLNSGEIILTGEDVTNMFSTCRVIGEVEANANAVVTIDNVYYTTEGFNGTVTWNRPKTDGVYISTLQGEDPEGVSAGWISGEYGAYYTELDFNKYWTVVLDNQDTSDVDETGTPELKSFADRICELPGVPDGADISWYENHTSPYEIDSREDLYGLAYLSKIGTTFEGEIIKISDNVSKIEINTTGTAQGWADGTENAEYVWEPIGTRAPFAGTFDGNGKTISGICVNTDAQGAGLFASTAEGSTIKDLRLENSSINSTYPSNWAFVGSVVGSCGGNLEKIYVANDVIVNATKSIVGGLVGEMHGSNEMSIDTCWFAGSVTAEGTVGGLVGVVTQGKVTINNCLNTGAVMKSNQKSCKNSLIRE